MIRKSNDFMSHILLRLRWEWSASAAQQTNVRSSICRAWCRFPLRMGPDLRKRVREGRMWDGLGAGQFNKESWDPQARALADRYGVLAIDMRYRGKSTGPWNRADALSLPLQLDVLGAVRYMRRTGATTIQLVGFFDRFQCVSYPSRFPCRFSL